MSFIRAIRPEEATGELRQAYERDRNAGQPGSIDIFVWAWFCTYWSGVLNAIGDEPPTKWVSKTRSLLGEGLWEALNVGRRVGTDDAGDT